MSTLDPSDLGNDINSFNIVECCEFTPMDIYILIPNLGYGFVSHVLDTFETSFYKLKPGDMFTMVSEPDSAVQSADGAALILEKNRFVPKGVGLEVGHMMAKISLNSQCAKSIRINPNLRLPIPFRVRDLNVGGEATADVLNHLIVKNRQLAIYAMMASVGNNNSADTISLKIAKAISVMHFRNVSDVVTTSTEEDVKKFIGLIDTTLERIEFSHLFPPASDTERLDYKTIAASSLSTEPDLLWKDCLLKPSVFVSYVNSAQDLRVYYSPELTTLLLNKIEIWGKDTPPLLHFDKAIYAFGIAAEDQANVQTWMTHVTEGSEATITGNSVCGSLYTDSEFLTKDMFTDDLHTGPIENLLVSLSGTSEQTVTATLLTPFPPMFTLGEAYRDSTAKNDTTFYLPFSQAYLLPIASYAQSASSGQEICEMCGGKGKIGFSNCVVCDSGKGIICPRCVTNEEIIDGVSTIVRGYNSYECPSCRAPGNEWVAIVGSSAIEEGLQYIIINGSRVPLWKNVPCSVCLRQAADLGSRVGKGPTGGVCTTCNGKGYLLCPTCGTSESPVPGIVRAPCAVCFDDDNDEYKGHTTPEEGLLKCSDENLIYGASQPETSDYYSHLATMAAPTCDDDNVLSPDQCPACTGSGLSYRFYGGPYGLTAENTYNPKKRYSSYIVLEEPAYSVDFTSLAVRKSGEFDTSGNVVMYLKLPAGTVNDPSWVDDTIAGATEDIPFKWIPPYMYELLTPTTIRFFGRLPKGTEIRLYNPPQFLFDLTQETLGHYITSSVSELKDGLIYDGGTWIYSEAPGNVPMDSSLKSIGYSNIYDLTYANPDDPETLPSWVEGDAVLCSEGFAHLSEAIRLYYKYLSEYKDTLTHIGTSRITEEPALPGIVSRFLYAYLHADIQELAPSDKSNNTSWIDLTRLSDVASIENGFLAALDNRQKTIGEFSIINLPEMPGLLNSEAKTSKDCAPIVTAMANVRKAGTLQYCSPNTKYVFSHASKAVAESIISNAGGPDIKALKGASILFDDTPPSSDTDTFPLPFKPSINVTDVSITNSGEIDIRSMFSNFVSVDDITLSKSAHDLAISLKTMGGKLENLMYSVMIKVDASGYITSPEPLFDQEQFVEARTMWLGNISTNLAEVKNLLGAGENPDENTSTFIAVLKEYEDSLKSNSKSDRPSNLISSTVMARGCYVQAASYLSAIAGNLVKPMARSEDDIRMILAVIDEDSKQTLEVEFTEDTLRRGLYLYNMRKAYYVIVSFISLMIAAIERLLVYSYALDRGYDPFPYSSDVNPGTTDICPLHIYGFVGAQGPCYPIVPADISLSTLDNTTATLNMISPFIDDDTAIRYDVKLEVPPLLEATLKPLPILGLGLSDPGVGWRTYDAYNFEPRLLDDGSKSLFAKFGEIDGDPAELDFASIGLPSLSGMSNLQDVFSLQDYMSYTSDLAIGYLSGGERTTWDGDVTLATALDNGVIEKILPPVAETSVVGTIAMTDLFPFLAGGPLVVGLPMSIAIENVEFVSGYPTDITGISSLSREYCTAGIIDGTTNVFQSNMDDVTAALKTACSKVLTFVSDPRNAMVIFTKMVADANYAYLFPIIGQADTLLGANKGESLIMSYLMNEADLPLTTSYATAKEVDAGKISTIMGNPTAWKTQSTGPDQILNYNLWLSKRRAYAMFAMITSTISQMSKERAPEWQAGKHYEKWDFVKVEVSIYQCNTTHDSSPEFATDVANWTDVTTTSTIENEEVLWKEYSTYQHPTIGELRYKIELIYDTADLLLTQTATKKIRRAFHCYGFGSLFQKEHTGSADERKNHRVTNIAVNIPTSQDSSRLWTWNHLGRPVSASLGSDLKQSESLAGVDAAAPTSNTYVGGWGNPKMGTQGEWDKCWTTIRSAVYDSPQAAKDTTDAFLKYIGGILTGVPVTENQLNSIKAVSKASVDAHISKFLGTADGVGLTAFSVPRSGMLTNNIWLVITKLN